MSLEATVIRAVDSAFSAAGDLTKKATLTKESTTGYDFVAQEINSTYEDLTVDVLEFKKETDTDSTVVTEFLAKSTEIDLSKYSVITIDSEKFDIASVRKEIGVVIISARSR